MTGNFMFNGITSAIYQISLMLLIFENEVPPMQLVLLMWTLSLIMTLIRVTWAACSIPTTLVMLQAWICAYPLLTACEQACWCLISGSDAMIPLLTTLMMWTITKRLKKDQCKGSIYVPRRLRDNRTWTQQAYDVIRDASRSLRTVQTIYDDTRRLPSWLAISAASQFRAHLDKREQERRKDHGWQHAIKRAQGR